MARYKGKVKGSGLEVVSGSEIDFESGSRLEVAGVAVTPDARELNLSDKEYQLLVADGAITVKNGICKIAKTVAGPVAATLADPTDVTDDFKMLTIISNQAQANTVTSASSFGGGGAGEDVATFSGAIGDSLTLIAHGAKWYVVGSHQCTIA